VGKRRRRAFITHERKNQGIGRKGVSTEEMGVRGSRTPGPEREKTVAGIKGTGTAAYARRSIPAAKEWK